MAEEELLPKMKAKHPAAAIETELRSSTPAFSPEGNDDAKTLAGSWSGSNTVGGGGLCHRGRHLPARCWACRRWSAAQYIAQAHQPNEFILASQIDAGEEFMKRMLEWSCRD